MFSLAKIIVFYLCIGATSFLFGANTSHPFGLESGMIIYEISGEAQLTPDTNLSIKGKAKLRFKNWGEVKLEEESGEVLTTGAIRHKQRVKRFEKQTKDKIIFADYENEQLLERTKTVNTETNDADTMFLEQKGKENIAGFVCDVWEGVGIKKCIYKGLVLKLETEVSAVSYRKIARQAIFDINTSNKACAVPDYPLQAFGLFKNHSKTKNAYKSENFCKVLKEVVFDKNKNNIKYIVDKVNMQSKERKLFINRIGQDIYKKQKVLLPELLFEMKQTRQCLHTGEDPFSANECIENFSRMKDKLGTQEDDYIILWDDKRKNILLDKIEDEIMYLQSRLPCVNRAKNISDLSTCLK